MEVGINYSCLCSWCIVVDTFIIVLVLQLRNKKFSAHYTLCRIALGAWLSACGRNIRCYTYCKAVFSTILKASHFLKDQFLLNLMTQTYA